MTEQTILAAKDSKTLAELSRQLAEQRRELTAKWGGVINTLNESRHDRLGWMPHPDLVDSQMASWGLRVNPVTAPTLLKLDGRNWLFQTDPETSRRWQHGLEQCDSRLSPILSKRGC